MVHSLGSVSAATVLDDSPQRNSVFMRLGFRQIEEVSVVTAKDLVVGGVRLFSLPQVCVRLNELVDSVSCSSSDIAGVISQDAALTARLLKIVNSPFYGFTSKVATVSRAITLIGGRELRDLAFATSAVRMFVSIPNTLVDMTSFWRHSIYSSVIARLVAAHCNVLHKERLFVAGLLHDIGQLVVFSKLPELAREALLQANTGGAPLYLSERAVIGFDHAEVGAELLNAWRLPPSTVEAVALHHEPDAAQDAPLEAAILHIADAMTDFAEHGIGTEISEVGISPVAMKITGLSVAALESLLEDARPQFIAALSLFLPVEAAKAAP